MILTVVVQFVILSIPLSFHQVEHNPWDLCEDPVHINYCNFAANETVSTYKDDFFLALQIHETGPNDECIKFFRLF